MYIDELARVVCRPALLKDTADMLELTRHIWEGNDYLPQVWAEWLADAQGFLAIAEYAGRVVGIAMLECQQPGEWYLAGLRVHPDVEGWGIAGRLHDYILEYWKGRHGRGVIRLATHRPKVKHLCERTGFQMICEYTIFVAPSLPEAVEIFTPLKKDQVDQALKLATSSPVFDWHARMYGHIWSWSAPQPKFIEAAMEKERAWLWRDGLAVLVTGEDRGDDGLPVPLIALLGCSLEHLPALLLDYRRLAAAQGYKQAGWIASLHPDLQPYLAGAGFRRDWDIALSLFERASG
jgi:GNAT superfamily N-acetyltransferase